MTSINHALQGIFTETNEQVVTHTRSNEFLYRSGKLNKARSETLLQVAQFEKLKICNRFINAFATDFFNKSFPGFGSAYTGNNRVMSLLMSQACRGAYPNMQLYYPHVSISKGTLQPAKFAAAVPMKDGNIYFNFTNNSNTGTAAENDKVILVAYAEALQQVAFSLNAGLRKDCEAVLQTGLFKGCTVETWIGFLSNDECNAGNSVWTGRLQL